MAASGDILRALCLLAPALLSGCDTLPDFEEQAVYPAPARGVVVCEEIRAARAGERILSAGGNAADAAVAAALVLAVTFPEAGNLGGGGFALWVPHDPREDAVAIDFRETAPEALTAAAFLDAGGEVDPERANRSALAVGVPGSVAGLFLLHETAGRLAWSDVVAPALAIAREGAVGESLAWRLSDPKVRAQLERGGAGADYYPGGEALDAGDPLPRAIATTLERIAREGPDGFYRGPSARALIDAIAARGGVMTLGDLAGYRAATREPLSGWFRGKEILTMPPPSSGGVVLLQALSILDGFPLDQEREETLARRPGGSGVSGRAVHWWIEALRRAFADRAEHLGDPDFVDVPVQRLLSPEWIAERRIAIGERASPEVRPMPREATEGDDTTHLSVLDAEGNAVSLTTTLNSSFGTGIYVPELGVFLNDEIDDFALAPGAPNQFGLVGGRANALEPKKRPLSSMTPVVVRDGGNAVTMLLGARGGPRIITAVFLVILRTEVYGESLQEAQGAPRLHQQWSPTTTFFEPGWDAPVLQELANRGHALEVTTARGAGVQAVRLRIGGEPEGVPDPRNPLGAACVQGRAPVLARALFASDPRWAAAHGAGGRGVDWDALAATTAEP